LKNFFFFNSHKDFSGDFHFFFIDNFSVQSKNSNKYFAKILELFFMKFIETKTLERNIQTNTFTYYGQIQFFCSSLDCLESLLTDFSVLSFALEKITLIFPPLSNSYFLKTVLLDFPASQKSSFLVAAEYCLLDIVVADMEKRL